MREGIGATEIAIISSKRISVSTGRFYNAITLNIDPDS